MKTRRGRLNGLFKMVEGEFSVVLINFTRAKNNSYNNSPFLFVTFGRKLYKLHSTGVIMRK